MEQQESAYDKLLSLAQRKREAIIRADPAPLQAIVQEEEQIIAQVQALEAARLDHLAPWAAQATQPADTLTITDLAGDLPPPLQATLLASRDRLQQRMDGLAQENGQNAALLQRSIGLLADSMTHLLQTAISDPRYTQDGNRATGWSDDSPRVLDYQA